MERTRRLYHEDPGLHTFDARILAAHAAGGGRTEVALDRTAFYPTGGGQPHDLGTLNGLPVVDVREEGDAVIHVVEGDPGRDDARGEVDRERRLDHRRQHTGQHILSRAFLETAGAGTVGFHLGVERVTIDLDREDLDDAAMAAAEALANRVVMDDVPVSASWHEDPRELPADIRRDAPQGGPIRLVRVGEFDANPCCGTHCLRAGEVGPIKILRWERKKGGLRVEFVCGGRAVADYARRHETLRALALALTTEEFEVPERVRALAEEAKGTRSRLARAEEELRDLLVERWIAEGGDGLLARDVGSGREAWLAPVASALAGRGGRRVLIWAGGADPARVAFAVPGGDAGHAGNLLRVALAGFGARGGGSDRLGQGQVPLADVGGLVERLRGA